LCCALIALGWRQRFADMGSLRLVHLAALRALNLRDRTFGWNVEMQVRAIEHGFRIVELPVAYHPRRAGAQYIAVFAFSSLPPGGGNSFTAAS